jgi:hypothetical protein
VFRDHYKEFQNATGKNLRWDLKGEEEFVRQRKSKIVLWEECATHEQR